MKKYNVSKTRCLRCGGFVSWDDFPNPRYPIHVDQEGNRIGDGSCPIFKPRLQSSHINGNKRLLSSKQVNTLALIGIVCILAISIAIGIMMYTYPHEVSSKDDNNNGDDEDQNGYAQTWEIDAQGNATYSVDGDTYDTDSEGRIRLADIDCPELGEAGSEDAKNYLSSLIYNKEVYLDIDDKYRTDPYGRIVAVTYVRYNTTHLLNVNKDLLVQGHATVWNLDNEFEPSSWSLYVYYA